MDQDEYVIFAELDRDRFVEILNALTGRFWRVDHGRQADDYIWVYFGEDKIEIDSFFSVELEVKGKRGRLGAAQEVLRCVEPDCILQSFDPPQVDMTR